jgi:hypothetical protein
MLAATPVLAQTNAPTGSTGAGGSTNAPTTHEAPPSGSAVMAPKAGMGTTASGSQDPTQDHAAHTASMRSHGEAHANRTETAQDAAVELLNEQSYAAAQKGEAFSGSPATTGPGTSSASTNTDAHGKM